MQTVNPGDIVLFTITEGHAKSINAQRTASGYATKTGNQARGGDVYPLLVVRLNSEHSLNGQLFLDGNDSYWLTSVSPSSPQLLNSIIPGGAPKLTDSEPGELPEVGHWHWPPRV